MPRNKRSRGSEGVPYLKMRTEKWLAEAKWILQQETDKTIINKNILDRCWVGGNLEAGLKVTRRLRRLSQLTSQLDLHSGHDSKVMRSSLTAVLHAQ